MSIDPHTIIDNDADCICLAECIPNLSQREYAYEHVSLAIRQLCDAVGEDDSLALEQEQ